MIPVVGPFLQAKLGLAGDAINWAVQLLLLREVVYLAKDAQGRILFLLQGPGEPMRYDELCGRPDMPDAWAAEAAAYALAGEVPVLSDDGYAVATFAGGCFWGIELLLQREPGVICTAAGYTQGKLERPRYKTVCSGSTGHCEAVQVVYDETQTSYPQLCEALMTQLGASMYKRNQVGNDRGSHYRSGIYPHTAAQHAEAESLLSKLQAEAPLFKSVKTEIEDAQIFWPAEEYHQRFLAKGSGGRPQSPAKRCAEKIRCYG